MVFKEVRGGVSDITSKLTEPPDKFESGRVGCSRLEENVRSHPTRQIITANRLRSNDLLSGDLHSAGTRNQVRNGYRYNSDHKRDEGIHDSEWRCQFSQNQDTHASEN